MRRGVKSVLLLKYGQEEAGQSVRQRRPTVSIRYHALHVGLTDGSLGDR